MKPGLLLPQKDVSAQRSKTLAELEKKSSSRSTIEGAAWTTDRDQVKSWGFKWLIVIFTSLVDSPATASQCLRLYQSIIGRGRDIELSKIELLTLKEGPLWLPLRGPPSRYHVYEVKMSGAEGAKAFDLSIASRVTGHPDLVMLARAKTMLASLPSAHLDGIHSIRYHNFTGPNGWAASAELVESSRTGIVDVFSNGSSVFTRFEWAGNMRHEFGHTVAFKFFGTGHPPPRYLAAMKRDARGISAYGDSALTEDFAEAVRVYLSSDGRRSAPILRRKFAARFEFLDELFKNEPSKLTLVKKILGETTLPRLTIFSGATGFLYYKFGDSIF